MVRIVMVELFLYDFLVFFLFLLFLLAVLLRGSAGGRVFARVGGVVWVLRLRGRGRYDGSMESSGEGLIVLRIHWERGPEMSFTASADQLKMGYSGKGAEGGNRTEGDLQRGSLRILRNCETA